MAIPHLGSDLLKVRPLMRFHLASAGRLLGSLRRDRSQLSCITAEKRVTLVFVQAAMRSQKRVRYLAQLLHRSRLVS
jgi:hypothetical protein